jgi:hypothetical protein
LNKKNTTIQWKTINVAPRLQIKITTVRQYRTQTNKPHKTAKAKLYDSWQKKPQNHSSNGCGRKNR